MRYARAPITEAVIELRFAKPCDKSVVETAGRRLRAEYYYLDNENTVQLRFEPAAQKSEVASTWAGVKLSSLDRADNVVYRQTTFVCSRLAPYTGWDDFLGRTKRAWQVWRKAAGVIALSRIGVRYVNRIDIPLAEQPLVRVEDYLNVVAKSPDDLGQALTSYMMQVVRPLGVDDCVLALNSGTVVSPLIGFASLALDLDVFREVNLPQRDEDLWDVLNRIRGHKNRIFENCITDRARALFT
jgi:uncharacterized protein (TIGR04255 family)